MIVDHSGDSPTPIQRKTANPRWDGADSGFQPPGQPVRSQDLDLGYVWSTSNEFVRSIENTFECVHSFAVKLAVIHLHPFLLAKY